MYIIQQITADPLQVQKLVLPDGSQLSLTIYFVPMQFGWFITNLTYGSFILNGVRITNSPNILNQWRNQIPFGLACYSTNQREPSQSQDFSSGASKLYLLDASETKEYAEFLANA